MTKQYANYADLITFSRSSGGTALRPISYGPELVTNGTFDSDTTGWADQASGSLSAVGGRGRLANVTLNGQSVQFFAAVVGKLYVVSAETYAGTANPTIAIGSTFNGSEYGQRVGTPGAYSLTFTATSTLISVRLQVQTSTVGQYAEFDNISVKEVLFDQPDAPLTLFNHPAGIPRVEFDADRNVLGLLVEESRTNYDFPSDAPTVPTNHFGNIFGITNDPIDLNAQSAATTALDGNLTALQLTWNNVTKRFGTPATNTSQHIPDGDVNATISIWAKSANQNNYTLSLNLRSTVTANVATVSITVTPEWKRFSLSSSRVSGDGSTGWYIEANSTQDIYVWGWQLEAGAFPTSYIPTSGSTVTRAADAASIPVADFGYNSAQGTLVCEFKVNESSITKRLASLNSDNTGNRMDALLISSNNVQLFVNDGGANQVGLNTPNTYTDGNVATLAFSYEKDNYAMTLSGGTIASDTSASVPNITQLEIGSGPTGDYANGHIKSIQYYPRRLSNAQLQGATK